MSLLMLQGGGGGYVANVITGILDPDKEVAKQNFLLNTVELDVANITLLHGFSMNLSRF